MFLQPEPYERMLLHLRKLWLTEQGPWGSHLFGPPRELGQAACRACLNPRRFVLHALVVGDCCLTLHASYTLTLRSLLLLVRSTLRSCMAATGRALWGACEMCSLRSLTCPATSCQIASSPSLSAGCSWFLVVAWKQPMCEFTQGRLLHPLDALPCVADTGPSPGKL
jgi:hypothetical protein